VYRRRHRRSIVAEARQTRSSDGGSRSNVQEQMTLCCEIERETLI